MSLPKFVHVGGMRIAVQLTKQPTAADGEACEGVYIVEDGVIQIKRSLRMERKWIKLAHEMAHAAIDDANLDLMLRNIVGDDARAVKLEEDIVDVISGPFVGALRTAGWLHFPGER